MLQVALRASKTSYVTNEKRKSPVLEWTNTGLETFSLLSHRKKPMEKTDGDTALLNESNLTGTFFAIRSQILPPQLQNVSRKMPKW